jgi:hypothetical protein
VQAVEIGGNAIGHASTSAEYLCPFGERVHYNTYTLSDLGMCVGDGYRRTPSR